MADPGLSGQWRQVRKVWRSLETSVDDDFRQKDRVPTLGVGRRNGELPLVRYELELLHLMLFVGHLLLSLSRLLEP